jgi:nicotinamidase-related amidase
MLKSKHKPKQPATRVVIDMQPTFAASNDPDVIIGVVKEILEAIREDAPILIVQYLGSGPTHRGLMNLVKKYKKSVKIYKQDNDGGKEIVRTIRKHRYSEQHLRVCGVNTDCCVLETVRSLLDLLKESKIEVVKNACGTEHNYGSFNWKTYPLHSNLKLV